MYAGRDTHRDVPSNATSSKLGVAPHSGQPNGDLSGLSPWVKIRPGKGRGGLDATGR